MRILFGIEKGGAGKSTAATNLAAFLAKQGEDVLLIDTDQQGSSSNWVATRNEDPKLGKVHCVAKTGNIADAIRDLGERYHHVIVDVCGRDSRELRSASLAVEKLYMPLKASQFDLWTVELMNEIIAQARVYNPELDAVALISMAPTNPQINEEREAREMLADFSELRLSKAVIRERKVYRDAQKLGRGVVEMNNAKAAAEIECLASEIYGASFAGLPVVGSTVSQTEPTLAQ